MIVDDDRLSELITQIGDGIEVPPDGPREILARRDELSSPRARRFQLVRPSRPSRRQLSAAAAVILVVAAGAAAGIGRHAGTTNRFGSVHQYASGAPSSTTSAPVFAAPGVPSSAGSGSLGGAAAGGGGAAGGVTAGANAAAAGPAGSGAPDSAGGSAPAPDSAGGSAPAPAPTPGPVPPPAVPARVVKTGAVTLVVSRGRLSATVDEMTNTVSGLGGYVTDAKSAEGGDSPTGDLTLRVPASSFETLLTRVRALGKPTSVTTSGQDVTAQYVDLDARIHSLQATRDQFLQLLSKATQIGDILNVEQQLSGLQTQIEQLQGQQRLLDDQSSFGTLAVHLSEASPSLIPAPVGPLKGPSGWSKAWNHARRSFTHGIQSVISASGGVAIFVVVVLLLAAVARLTWAVIRRRLV